MAETTPEENREQQRSYFESSLRTYVGNVGGTFDDPQLHNGEHRYTFSVPIISAAPLKFFLEVRSYIYDADESAAFPEKGRFSMTKDNDKYTVRVTGVF